MLMGEHEEMARHLAISSRWNAQVLALTTEL
jgi:hypothetical protein